MSTKLKKKKWKLKKRNRFVLCLEHRYAGAHKYASFGAKCEVCATTLLRSTLLAAKKKDSLIPGSNW